MLLFCMTHTSTQEAPVDKSSPPGIRLAFIDGMALFSKNAVMIIVATLVYLVIVLVGSMIPFVNFLFWLLVLPVLVGGYIIFSLNVAKGKEPKFEDLFASFNDYVTWLGAWWLLIAYAVLFGIPAIILIIIGVLVKGYIGALLIIVGGHGWIVLIFFFVIKWYVFMFIIADNWHDSSIKTAFDKSVKLTQKRLLEVFFVALVMGIFAGAGAIVLGVGMLVTAPIGFIGVASYYLRIKEEYLSRSGRIAPPAGHDTPAFEVGSIQPPPPPPG